jgi:hypothetical protein
MGKKFWIGLIAVAIIFVLTSFTVCYNLSPKVVILKNDLGLPMRVWVERERGVVVKNIPKTNEVFQFMIISIHRLEKISEQDALWESCSGGECLYFRLTNDEPRG